MQPYSAFQPYLFNSNQFDCLYIASVFCTFLILPNFILNCNINLNVFHFSVSMLFPIKVSGLVTTNFEITFF